jgi:hypothetical protein
MEDKRIIVHLIEGEAKKAHENITRSLVDKLDAFPTRSSPSTPHYQTMV